MQGARITAINTETGGFRGALSNDRGNHTLPVLPPGSYRGSVESAGFKQVAPSGVEVGVNQAGRPDFPPGHGAITDKVEVTAGAPQVERESAAMGTVVDNRKIANIPLNTRDPFALALVVPGVVPSRNFGDLFNSSAKFSINVGRSHSNEVMIDGVSNALPSAQ